MHIVVLFVPHSFISDKLFVGFIHPVGWGRKGYAGDHYVAHKRHNQVWVQYDDAKVNKSAIHGQCTVNLAFFRNTTTRNPLPFTIDLAKIKHLRGERSRGGVNKGRGSGAVRGREKGRGKTSTVSVDPAAIKVTSAEPTPSNVLATDSKAVDTSQNIDQTVEDPTTSDNVNQSQTDSTPVAPIQNVGQTVDDPTTADNVNQSQTDSTPVAPIPNSGDPLPYSNVSINVEIPIPVNTDDTQQDKPVNLQGSELDKELLAFLTEQNLGGSIEPLANINTDTTEPVHVQGNTVEDIPPSNIDNVESFVPIIGHVQLTTQGDYDKRIERKNRSEIFGCMCEKTCQLA